MHFSQGRILTDKHSITQFIKRPNSIAHRGASAYAPANTLEDFRIAAVLGADYWEVDVRLTADDQLIAFHDGCVADGRAVADITLEQLRDCTPGPVAPLLARVLALALEYDTGIYADIKALDAAIPMLNLLSENNIRRAILGAFDEQVVAQLRGADSQYPCAVLVPVGADPFELAKGADIIHLCWEKMYRPQDKLDSTFFERCASAGKQVVLWHEEDPVRMAELRLKPVLGICSNRPELVNRFTPHSDWPVQVVCHRGANEIAPKNTLAALHAAFAAGFSHTEIDVHASLDGELVVMHDLSLDRTSSGKGLISNHTLDELRALDTGSWFSPYFSDELIPTLDECLGLARLYQASLYIELKTAPVAWVWDSVIAYGMQDRCFFWSFNSRSLAELRDISQTARIMVRRQDFATLDSAIGFQRPSLVEYSLADDWSEFASLRKQDIQSMIAYNGRDPGVMLQIIEARPDLVNLDKPFLFAKVCNSAGLADCSYR